MRVPKSSLFGAAILLTAQGALAADPASCQNVRMAEPGWNDLAFTTGVASVLLEGLGYSPSTNLLGMEIIYSGLQNKDLDVFLGYWDPAMEAYFKPYRDDGSVVTLRQNLEGAKFTFAVPRYVYDAGVHDFADLDKYAEKFERKMYGIEPGSNQLMEDIIKKDAFGLGDWELVESSEQAMISQVKKATIKADWILFLGWAPHPMNNEIEMEYLTGGDEWYGPNLGGATVHTQIRNGYAEECPNVVALLNNLTFTLPLENEGMSYLINEGIAPTEAAMQAIKAHPELLEQWLKGITTIGDGNGLAAVKAHLGLM